VSTSPSVKTATSYDYDAADLAFGKFGETKTTKNAPRMRMFPSSNSPLVVYLGLKRDAKTAAFLVSNSVTVRGPGKCVPSPSTCDLLYLKVGQQELLLTNTNGTVVAYDLKVSNVRLVQVATAAAARIAKARVSQQGQLYVKAARHTDPSLPWPSYSQKTGFLTVPGPHVAQDVVQGPDMHMGPLAPVQAAQW
jgi:hypothetical protein